MKEFIDKQEFEAFCDANKHVVVYCYATWSGPCKLLALKIEQLATENTDIQFVKVDVDQAENIAGFFSISIIPTVLFFRNGVILGDLTVQGANEHKIKESVQTLSELK